MPVKWNEALQSVRLLLAGPFEVKASVGFVDAMAGSWLIRTIYRRMLEGIPADTVERIRGVTERPIDVEALRQLPANTFGRKYVDFLEGYQLNATEQVDAYPELAKTMTADWMTRRFVKIHDLIHVLTGLGVDGQGEMGVQMFYLRNFHEPYGALATAGLPLVLLRYGDPRRLLRSMEVGWTAGGRAQNLFFTPLEDMFEVDFEELRGRLGLARERGAPH